jgi:tRNA threonylcarbamoyladenosine modification (KEOPS) complex Cgi121 subunit
VQIAEDAQLSGCLKVRREQHIVVAAGKALKDLEQADVEGALLGWWRMARS